MTGAAVNYLAEAKDPKVTLNDFTFEDLAQFRREGSFPATDSPDFRVFYVGRDDVHGVLKYLLARCSRSLYMSMFGFDDDELNEVIMHLVEDSHVFTQGTLDRSQAGGVHERKILATWSDEMRASFAIGQSSTHQILHSKGGVLDGLVAFEGSTNWSDSGEGTGIVLGDGAQQKPGFKAQANTLTVYIHPIQIAQFTAQLNEEHNVALAQQIKRAERAA